jgi:hypothetical protein
MSTSETSTTGDVNLTLAMRMPARLLVFEYASSLADGPAPPLVTFEPGFYRWSDSCRTA